MQPVHHIPVPSGAVRSDADQMANSRSSNAIQAILTRTLDCQESASVKAALSPKAFNQAFCVTTRASARRAGEKRAASQEDQVELPAKRICREEVSRCGRGALQTKRNGKKMASAQDAIPTGWVQSLPTLERDPWVAHAIEVCSARPPHSASIIAIENHCSVLVRMVAAGPESVREGSVPSTPKPMSSWELYVSRWEHEGKMEAQPPHPIRFTDRRLGGS